MQVHVEQVAQNNEPHTWPKGGHGSGTPESMQELHNDESHSSLA